MGWFETLKKLEDVEEEVAPLTTNNKPVSSKAEKRSADHLESEFARKRSNDVELLQQQNATPANPKAFLTQLFSQPKVGSADELFKALKQICTLLYANPEFHSKLTEKEWNSLVENILFDFDWRGLNLVLSLARKDSQAWFPQVWLPLVYQTCSRLVRDPSSQGADAFRTGASFRGHPSAFFDIGVSGGLRLVHSRWGKLRGYSFCVWVNLRKSTQKSRQLFHFGSLANGCMTECYLQENSNGDFQFFLRSRQSSTVSWSTLEAPAAIAVNRWHFIVVSHARPYLLGKAKLGIFVDGVQQCASSLPFPSTSKEIDDCVLGQGLDGLLGSPSLYEGGDVNAAEAVNLCDRSRIHIETPHVVGEAEDDHDVDGEDDELTAGLGYGQVDARDLHVEAREMIREIATRAVVQQSELKRMIFSFDPRAADEQGFCPELVIHGISRGRLDALELAATSVEDAQVANSVSLLEDEQENDARLEGDCTVCVENSTRRDCVELAGGCRALLMTVADAPRSAFGDALMFLGDALHADTHLRSSFLASEGFELIGRAIRERFYEKEANEEDVVLVQVALHMMRAAPVKSALEHRFLVSGLKELLLDARVSEQRACQTLRLVSGLAADNPTCVRDAVGIEGLLKFMWKLEAFPESQTELVSEVIHHVWTTTAVESASTPGPTFAEMANTLGYIAEHPTSAGSSALLREVTDLVRNGNVPTLRALASLGGISYLIRLGSFTENNVKNAETGMIIKNPEPIPALLSTENTPPETRCAMIELIGVLIRKRAAACIPLDPDNPLLPGLLDSEAIDNDMVIQLGHLLGTIHNDHYTERHEMVVKCLLDCLPKPHGFFVWAVPCAASGDAQGMQRVADNLQKNAVLAKSVLNQKGWPSCFTPSVFLQGDIGNAARQSIVAIISRAEDARHLDALVATTPPIVWSAAVASLIENSFAEIAPALLVRALATARRADMVGAEDKAFLIKSLAVCEHLRSIGHWHSAWSLVVSVLPTTTEVDVAEACVRLGLGLASKEMLKPASSDNRKRITQLLKQMSGTLEDAGGAGQLRAEMCLGLVQNFPIADDGVAFQRYVQECLEKSSTIPHAIQRIVDTLPSFVIANDYSTEHQVKSNSVVHESAVHAASRQTNQFSLRMRQYLKKRAVEQVRDQLAFKVTEKVRDRRFDARWAQLKHDEDVERRAWHAETKAFTMDQTFCERGSRVRRRLVHSSEADLAKMKSVISRSVAISSAAMASVEAEEQSTIANKEEDNEVETMKPTTAQDWVKIGEEVSRATQIKGHTDLEQVSMAASTHSAGAEEEETLPELPTPINRAAAAPPADGEKHVLAERRESSSISAATSSAPPPADAKAKKMTLQEWVNRAPLSIRGELEGKWIDINAGERIMMAARSFIVRLDGECPGRLVVSNYALYFDPDPPGAAGNYFDLPAASVGAEDNKYNKSEQDKFEPRQRWSLIGIQRVLLRRHRMMESGIELFMRGDACKSVFLRFEDVTNKTRKTIRDKVVKLIISLLPRSARERSQSPGRNAVRSLVDNATYAWHLGGLSNFEYIMELNMLAGRSVHDLCQYPVFPWVLSDYTSEELDLQNPNSYRDLSKPMGALDPDRLEQYIERYETFDDPMIPKFHYGSHYSTAAGTALHYLVRIEPFRSLHVEMHDNRYDVPDRLFTSVAHSWESSSTSQDLGEVKELTSEFYSVPAMFENRGDINLGVSQNGHKVGAVQLPPWAKNSAHSFVQQMRAALESTHASANLHQWIDLIFGIKQRGEQAVLAHNVFFYLTYPGAVDLESMEDLNMRQAVEHQIAHFGQCPEQLESRYTWPARTFTPGKQERFVLRPRSGVEVAFSIDRDVPMLQARVVLRKPITSIPAEDVEMDDGGGGGILSIDSQGTLYQLIANETDKDSSKPRAELRGVRQPFAWSTDGTLMISASRAAQGTVELVRVGGVFGEATAKATLFAHDEQITCITYDDGLLLTGAGDGAIRLWRVGHAGALKRTTVWTRPRRFLCGHAIGERITCAAVERTMGVAATASRATGVLVHDVLSGSLLFRIPQYTEASKMLWDSASGSLFVLFADHSMAVVSVDGSILKQTKADGNVVCVERIAPNTIAVSKGSSVEILELPNLTSVQSWPLPDVSAITPAGDEHVVVNLITASRSVFVLRRSIPVAQQSAFKALREAPTAVVGAVSNAVSSRVSLVGALDTVRSGVQVGKGVSGEAWEAFSSATGFFSSKRE